MNEKSSSVQSESVLSIYFFSYILSHCTGLFQSLRFSSFKDTVQLSCLFDVSVNFWNTQRKTKKEILFSKRKIYFTLTWTEYILIHNIMYLQHSWSVIIVRFKATAILNMFDESIFLFVISNFIESFCSLQFIWDIHIHLSNREKIKVMQ